MNRTPDEERRRSNEPFKGDERRSDRERLPRYSSNEMPRDPTPGDPGKEAAIERDRLDRETKKGVHKSS